MRPMHDFSMELNFTGIYKRFKNAPIAIREAMCLQAQFPSVLSDILEQDALAGRVEWGQVGFSPHNNPPNCGYGYYCNDEKIIEAIEKGEIPLGQRNELWNMLHFWKKETTQNQVEAAFDPRMTQYLFRDEINPLPFNYKPMVAQPIYRMAGVFVDYSKLLKLGVSGLRKEISSHHEKAVLENGDAAFYEGMLLVLDVFSDSCHYYQDQALQKAESAGSPERKQELLTMAASLATVANDPPATFQEALQMSWLYTLMCGTLELGRMDIYLGDFYAQDIDHGIITEEQALKLMRSLWRIINDLFREVDGRIIIGGKGRPNEKNADRFALLALETTRTYGRAKLPQLTLRFYEGMNPRLIGKALELIGEGHTFPLLYNDDVLIPATQSAHNVPERIEGGGNNSAQWLGPHHP
jgi:pyruvate-formate lyase